MNDDDRRICNRITETANTCYSRNIQTYTDFLDLHEQSLLNTVIKNFPPVEYKTMGGFDMAERKILVFYPYEDFPIVSPFVILNIKATDSRFSKEKLSHRDFLGSLLGLGLERCVFGDIVTQEDNSAYVVVMKKMADYVCNNLVKVRNTPVSCEISEKKDISNEIRFKEISGSVASVRLDAIIALSFGISRNHIIEYIENGKVYVNGRVITTNAYKISPLDIISVRGLGKVKFAGESKTTAKMRHIVTVLRYE